MWSSYLKKKKESKEFTWLSEELGTGFTPALSSGPPGTRARGLGLQRVVGGGEAGGSEV